MINTKVREQMFGSRLLLILVFAGGLFLLLGGPLWLSTRARIFARGRRAPRWLQLVTSWGSRLAGLYVLVYSVWTVAHGEVLPFLLLLAVLAIGFFLLLNGPLRLVSVSKGLAHGREAPLWLVEAATMVNRILGVATPVALLYVLFRLVG